jgi:hypothetical protein
MWLLKMMTRAGGVAPVVERLPSKLEALSSNPINTKMVVTAVLLANPSDVGVAL